MSAVDTYFDKLAPEQQQPLQHIRSFIKQQVPEAEEGISYGMPVFKYQGAYLIGLSGFKNHMSIFPGSEPIAVMAHKLSGFKCSKGTIQFTLDNPLPDPILEEVVAICLARISKQ